MITRYTEDYFIFNNQQYGYGVLISNDTITPTRLVSSHLELNESDFEGITGILLIGTGKNTKKIHQSLKIHLKNQGVIVECASNDAVIRTYNVLSSEKRNVHAALMVSCTSY